jgi:(p)ppGpp synthase/HD superfamily hydrolase
VQLLTKKNGQNVQEYLKAIDESEYSSWLVIVKLADRLNNVRCLAYINNPEKVARKCEETRQYFMDYAKKYSDYVYKELEKALKSVGA